MGQARDEAGNLWETDANGNAIRLLQAAEGRRGRVIAPPQSAKDQASTAKTYQEIATDQERLALDQKKFVQQQAEFRAKMQQDGFVQDGNGQWVRDPNWKPTPTAENVKVDRDRLARLNALVKQVNRTQELYNQDIAPEPYGWMSSLGDYLPTSINERFDTSGAQLSEKGLGAFKVPGTGNVTDRDAIMFDKANLPAASNKDLAIEEKLRGIRERVAEEFQSLGLEPPAWTGVDQRGEAIVGAGTSSVPPSGGNGGGGGGPQLGLSRGETYTTPEDLARADAMNKALARPNVTLEDLVSTARGYGAPVTLQDIENMKRALEVKAQGGAAGFTPNASGKRDQLDVILGNALMSPTGTAAATAVSGLGFNALDGIFNGKMQALRDLNPGMAAVGDVGGAIGGTAALSKLVRGGVEQGLSRFSQKAADRLLSDTARARLTRGVLADTAFGTSYGANVEGNAALGGGSAAVGSLAGNAAGKVLGAALGGIRRTPAAEYLKGQGIDLTIGQQMGGNWKRLEDAMTSVPFAGDMVINRNADSITGLNRAAFREAGIDGIGKEGMEALGQARQQAYTDAVAGRQFDLNDPQTIQEMQAALTARNSLPPDYAAKFDIAVQNRVANTPIGQTGEMTGEQFQQSMRGLNDYKNIEGVSGFEDDYRNAIGGVQGALRGVVERQSPEIIPYLKQADQLYRKEKILQDALNRNRKDASGIGTDLFRPSDLTEAAFQNSKKFGKPPFFDLAKAAQEVIPSKLPDSGTARRIMVGTIGAGGLTGGGALTGYNGENTQGADLLSGGGQGALSALGIAALLSASGSKAGQKALTKVLMERPKVLQDFGAFIRKQQGLLGTAAAPLFIKASQ